MLSTCGKPSHSQITDSSWSFWFSILHLCSMQSDIHNKCKWILPFGDIAYLLLSFFSSMPLQMFQHCNHSILVQMWPLSGCVVIHIVMATQGCHLLISVGLNCVWLNEVLALFIKAYNLVNQVQLVQLGSFVHVWVIRIKLCMSEIYILLFLWFMWLSHKCQLSEHWCVAGNVPSSGFMTWNVTHSELYSKYDSNWAVLHCDSNWAVLHCDSNWAVLLSPWYCKGKMSLAIPKTEAKHVVMCHWTKEARKCQSKAPGPWQRVNFIHMELQCLS